MSSEMSMYSALPADTVLEVVKAAMEREGIKVRTSEGLVVTGRTRFNALTLRDTVHAVVVPATVGSYLTLTCRPMWPQLIDYGRGARVVRRLAQRVQTTDSNPSQFLED